MIRVSPLRSFPLYAIIVPILVSCADAQNSWRDRWQQPDAIMDSVGVKAGMVIGEAGAGDGYFTFHLAKRVGDKGMVYANDIDEGALEDLRDRMKREGVTNIVTVLGEVDDPVYPRGDLDMVTMMLAFHDFSEPQAWMANVIQYMKPDARLVIVDRDPDKTRSSWDHFMTKAQILAAMEKTRFVLEHVYTFLERDNIYVYKIGPPLRK